MPVAPARPPRNTNGRGVILDQSFAPRVILKKQKRAGRETALFPRTWFELGKGAFPPPRGWTRNAERFHNTNRNCAPVFSRRWVGKLTFWV